LDLGLIYRRDQVFAQMTVGKFTLPSHTLHFEEGYHYLYCLEKSFKVADLIVKEGDTLKIDEAPSLDFKAKEAVRYLHIAIQFKA
jgi:hypothetical protein